MYVICMHMHAPQHPLPPFTAETALKKTKAAEAAWNTRDPAKVAAAYSPDTVWRNRDEIFAGRYTAALRVRTSATLRNPCLLVTEIIVWSVF